MKDLAIIFLLILFLLTAWMLYLAEQDAAKWHSIATRAEVDRDMYRDTARIQTIALQNFCRPIEVKSVKLGSPITRGE
jgi:hypothetical protein